jgi:DNA-binding IclR family transcriptional regulator
MSIRAATTGHAESAGTRYRNQATQRVLAVLSAFAGFGEARGVSELARALGMNKNMVHRALTTLTEEGYLVRDPSGERYQLGYRVLALRVEDVDDVDIRALSRPVLEELHRLTGESVFLSIIVGSSRVNVDWIEARGRRVSHSQRGRSVPLHCTKMSRMLLGSLSDDEIDEYLASAAPLDRYAEVFPDTIGMTAQTVWDDIRRMRGQEYVTWRNPRQFGGAYVAFPVPDSADRLHAIVTVGGPMERFGLERIEALLPSMRDVLVPLQQQGRLFPAAPVLVMSGSAA